VEDLSLLGSCVVSIGKQLLMFQMIVEALNCNIYQSRSTHKRVLELLLPEYECNMIL
jgi:hypothetical protein